MNCLHKRNPPIVHRDLTAKSWRTHHHIPPSAKNVVVFPSRNAAIEDALRLLSPRLALVAVHLTRQPPRQWLTCLFVERIILVFSTAALSKRNVDGDSFMVHMDVDQTLQTVKQDLKSKNNLCEENLYAVRSASQWKAGLIINNMALLLEVLQQQSKVRITGGLLKPKKNIQGATLISVDGSSSHVKREEPLVEVTCHHCAGQKE
ncbi:hypothetical protein Nepgr_006402 [Nepenthes gracilis]|uniref:Uncharacterized protein n=1 Tax=Nepenthes gracilis TaxID=150966 RepID=A0AAD3S5K3_NEPGR|nr:hypothetical protein Nepgr_006402 [Nepenthes gracilis]